MKLIRDILYKVAIKSVLGSTDREVSKIEFDSRKVQQNNVFVAIKGNANDGHHYIEKAIKKGAIAILSIPSLLSRPRYITLFKKIQIFPKKCYLHLNFMTDK